MKKQTKNKFKKYVLTGLIILITVYVSVFLFNISKPLPEGISYESEIYSIDESEISFVYDLTYINQNETLVEQEIFDNAFEIIDNANKFIILDFFLFNTDYSQKGYYRDLSTELKNKLIEKKKSNPNIQIYFITDEINNFYGSYESKEILELKENNISVTITKLEELRDSNTAYSAFWRTFIQWFGTKGEGFITHPLGNDEKEVTLRSFLKLMNTKANHRKVLVADNGNSLSSLIISANPHSASSKHSNMGFLIEGAFANEIIKAEKSVAKFSGTTIQVNEKELPSSGDIQVQLLTEGKIKSHLIKDLDSTLSGESIEIAMFYLSDRDVINSLISASNRGVNVSLILDANKDAFAREKNGIPNRPVAYELIKKSSGKINIRWFNTNGEQFHSKLIIITKKGKLIVYGGSANLTRRNINDLNLEADVKITSPLNSSFSLETKDYFKRIFENKNCNCSLDFDVFKENSKFKYFIYRIQEVSGFSSF